MTLSELLDKYYGAVRIEWAMNDKHKEVERSSQLYEGSDEDLLASDIVCFEVQAEKLLVTLKGGN